MADEDVNIRFGASIDDLKAKLGEVQGIFGKVAERFAVMAAVVAGGAAFKEFINETVQLNAEAMKLSRTLGITVAEAATLNTALGDIYADADTYTGAFLKFNRALHTQSDEMKALGVDVVSLKNGQKDSNQVFQEALQIVGQYKPGIDQTQIAMRLFGRSVEDVQKLMKLNAGVIDEARRKNQELNLGLSQEGVDAVKKYKAAMNDVGDVMTGLKKTIGEGVIPVFTKSAEQLASIGPSLVAGMQAAITTFVAIWEVVGETVGSVWSLVSEIMDGFREVWESFFGKDGPGAMEIFKNALRLVEAVFVGFKIGVELFVLAIKTAFIGLGNTMNTFAEVASAALRLDFGAAKAAWQAGMEERNRILADGASKAAEIASKGADRLNAALIGGATPKPTTPAGMPASTGTGDKKAPIGDSGASDGARLALQQAQQEAALNLEREYLRQAQSIYADAYSKGLVTTKGYYDAQLAIELKAIDASIAAKKNEAAASGKAAGGAVKEPDRLKFQAQEQKLLGEINVLEARRNDTVRANGVAYVAAEQQRMDALTAMAASRAKSSADAGIEAERAALNQLVALREVSAQDAFKIDVQLEQKSYDATVALLKAKAEAISGTDAEVAQARAALEAEAENAAQSHQQRLTGIANAAELDRSKYAQSVQQQAQTDFARMIEAMAQGTLTVSDAFKGMGKWIEKTFLDLIAQRFTEQLFDTAGINTAISTIVNTVTEGVTAIVKKFLLAETQKTAAEKTGAVQRKAVQSAESTASMATTAAKTEFSIAAEVVEGEAAVAGAATKIAADEGASGASIAATAASAIANIAAKAWEVAASVYSALAGIPYIGPFIAPVAAIAATAVVLGFVGRISSSEGGEMQVGEDRLNFVHKNETILPAPFAAGLRELVGKGSVGQLKEGMSQILNTLSPTGARPNPSEQPPAAGIPTTADAGVAPSPDWWQVPENPAPGIRSAQAGAIQPVGTSSTGGGGAGDTFHFSVDAVDGASVKKLFMEHGPALAKALQNQARNLSKPKK